MPMSRICKKAFYHIRRISRIKKFLFRSSIFKLLHSFVFSHLDYCNSILVGLSSSSIDRLQRVQNCAARLVTGARRFDSITPHLKSLHWLPIKQMMQNRPHHVTLSKQLCSLLSDLYSFYHPTRSSSYSPRSFVLSHLVVSSFLDPARKRMVTELSPSAALESGMRYLKTFAHPISYPNSNFATKPIIFAWHTNESILCINVEFAPLIKSLEEARYK